MIMLFGNTGLHWRVVLWSFIEIMSDISLTLHWIDTCQHINTPVLVLGNILTFHWTVAWKYINTSVNCCLITHWWFTELMYGNADTSDCVLRWMVAWHYIDTLVECLATNGVSVNHCVATYRHFSVVVWQCVGSLLNCCLATHWYISNIGW